MYRDEDQLKKRKARKRLHKTSPVRGRTVAATKVVPEASKVKKVAPPAKQPPKKAAAASKKPIAEITKRVATKEAKTIAEAPKTR